MCVPSLTASSGRPEAWAVLPLSTVYCPLSIVLLRYPFIWQAGKPALWRSAVRRPRSGL